MSHDRFCPDISTQMISRAVGGLEWTLGMQWAPRHVPEGRCLLAYRSGWPAALPVWRNGGQWRLPDRQGDRPLPEPEGVWWTLIELPAG